MDALWPAAYVSPMGRRLPIDYEAETPTIEARLQELFGITEHPVAGPDRRPLRLVLLSPGQKPIAVTTDALTHKLTAVLPGLVQALPGGPGLDEAQAAALSPVLVRALQLAASPDGGVHAAVQFLGEYAANPGT